MSFLPPALCCQPPSLGPAWCLEPGTGETPSAGLWAFLWVEPGSSQTAKSPQACRLGTERSDTQCKCEARLSASVSTYQNTRKHLN